MAEEIKKDQTTNTNVDDGQGQSDDSKDTKVYMTQEEVDAAIEKRLSRERKKQGKKSESTEAENQEKPESKQQDNGRLEALEAKIVCYDAGVKKDCIFDVVALAKAYIEDEDTSFEEAVEKVLKKHPQFKNASGDEEKEEEKQKGSWGRRQGKSSTNDVDGVEEAFLKRNPGLKID